MNKIVQQKEIEDNISIRNNLWNALIVTTGGTLSLIIHLDSLVKTILMFMGIFFIAVFLKGYFYRVSLIEKFKKDLKGV